MSAAFHSVVGETATAVRVGCAVCKARSTSFPVTSFPVNPWEVKTYMYSHPEIDRYYVFIYIYGLHIHIYMCMYILCEECIRVPSKIMFYLLQDGGSFEIRAQFVYSNARGHTG